MYKNSATKEEANKEQTRQQENNNSRPLTVMYLQPHMTTPIKTACLAYMPKLVSHIKLYYALKCENLTLAVNGHIYNYLHDASSIKSAKM